MCGGRLGEVRGEGIRFLGFEFLGFLVSWPLGFKVSKTYQIAISCFLEDIDLISNIFKTLLDGSPGFVGARLVQHFQTFEFHF